MKIKEEKIYDMMAKGAEFIHRRAFELQGIVCAGTASETEEEEYKHAEYCSRLLYNAERIAEEERVNISLFGSIGWMWIKDLLMKQNIRYKLYYSGRETFISIDRRQVKKYRSLLDNH